jgi:site-specific DNA-methyltransferase (adenine-specific)
MVANDARAGDPLHDQWFTPFWAAEELVADALRSLGSVSIVEPACGTGAFLSAIPPHLPAFGVDIDPAVVRAAVANSGREVIVGDFRTVDLSGREVQLVIGNPPFPMATVEGFMQRSHQLLPDGGMVAMILPAFAFQTPSRVARWMDHYSIDVSLIPRTLFGKIAQALVWAKFIKGGQRRFHGLMLFAEQRDIEQMRPMFREALAGPGTWREAVRRALEALGGEASLSAIYDLITPERRVSQHWQPKVRQTLQLHHRPVERGRWAL